MTSTALAALLSRPRVTLRPWHDAVVERVGHDARGDYVELFWLGTLGPTATWLLRRLAIVVATQPDGADMPLTDVARGLGLGPETSTRSILGKSLGRLEIFGLARAERDHLAIRTVVPPLPYKQLARLPDHLREAHTLWNDESPGRALALACACSRSL